MKVAFFGPGIDDVVIEAFTSEEMAQKINEHPGIPARAEFDSKKNEMTIYQWIQGIEAREC